MMSDTITRKKKNSNLLKQWLSYFNYVHYCLFFFILIMVEIIKKNL